MQDFPRCRDSDSDPYSPFLLRVGIRVQVCTCIRDRQMCLWRENVVSLLSLWLQRLSAECCWYPAYLIHWRIHRGGGTRYALPLVKFLSFSCSFRHKSCLIKGFCFKLWGLPPPPPPRPPRLENPGSATE